MDKGQEMARYAAVIQAGGKFSDGVLPGGGVAVAPANPGPVGTRCSPLRPADVEGNPLLGQVNLRLNPLPQRLRLIG
jgi:hypothetical protein